MIQPDELEICRKIYAQGGGEIINYPRSHKWPDAQQVSIKPGLVDLKIQREDGELEEWRVNASLIISALDAFFDGVPSKINLYTGEQSVCLPSSELKSEPPLDNHH